MKNGDDATNERIMIRYLNHGIMICSACTYEQQHFRDYEVHNLIRSMRPDLQDRKLIRELASDIKLLIQNKKADTPSQANSSQFMIRDKPIKIYLPHTK